MNRVELQQLKAAIFYFANGEQAKMPFEQHMAPGIPKLEPDQTQPVTAEDGWFFKVIVPIPHKGQKRDEYLKAPDTIGSLFEARHGDDEESEAARQRLWGFVNNYEPNGWTKKDGTAMPASDSDKKFREALDAFAEWFENNHPGEKL